MVVILAIGLIIKHFYPDIFKRPFKAIPKIVLQMIVTLIRVLIVRTVVTPCLGVLRLVVEGSQNHFFSLHVGIIGGPKRGKIFVIIHGDFSATNCGARGKKKTNNNDKGDFMPKFCFSHGRDTSFNLFLRQNSLIWRKYSGQKTSVSSKMTPKLGSK
jgi:hypothetical protein